MQSRPADMGETFHERCRKIIRETLMRRAIMAIALMAISACAEQPSEEEIAAQAERAVAQVKAVNSTAPPIEEKIPEAIGYPDIERHDMFGQVCAYAPGTSLGARVIARETDAFVKVDGEIIRLAADPGARKMPSNTRSLYNGTTYSLRLTIESEGREDPVSVGTMLYDGTMYLRDSWDRVIYEGAGLVSCGV